MTEISNGLAIGLGMGTVFFGLICLIAICYIMSAICKMFAKSEKKETVPTAPAVPVVNEPIRNKQEVLAACCAVIAEVEGTDANNIKVLSFKRV